MEEIGMSLIDAFKTECVLLERRRVSDGEGGLTTRWLDGPEFTAAITEKDSTLARLAEQQGVTATHTLTTDRSLVLEFHDAFRRLSDGMGFRVVKVLDPTPGVATFQFNQYQVEEWEPVDADS
jgi:hypothetical protein